MEVPAAPSLGLVEFLEQLTEHRETLLRFTSLLKDVIKDTDEWPDEEVHREGPKHRSFCPMELGCTNLLETLKTLCFWGFMAAASHRHDLSLSPFPAPFSLQRMKGVAENSILLSMVWSF